MKIESKFNIGDYLFFLDENRINCMQVSCIDIKIFKDNIDLFYVFGGVGGIYPPYKTEKQVFKTKQELIASL